MNALYIPQAAIVAEIKRRKKFAEKRLENNNSYSEEGNLAWERDEALYNSYNSLLNFIDTLEAKEINYTWHLQKNENIYDAVKDWSLHSFICLMDDGSIQKFTGIRCPDSNGSVNSHIDAVDDNYDTNNIIFWIETPL